MRRRVVSPSGVAKEPDLGTALMHLLDLLSVRVAPSSIVRALEGHPDYPSMMAAVDALGAWGLTAEGFEVQPSALRMLPTPCLAEIEGDDLEYVVVTSSEGDRVEFIGPERGSRALTAEEFLAVWNGRVLVVEADEEAGEPRYPDKMRAERRRRWRWLGSALGLVALSLSVATLTLSATGGSPLWTAYFLTKLFGLIFTIPLVSYHLHGKVDGLLSRMCGDGDHSGCATVLASRAAYLPGGIAVAEVGLVYFTGGLLTLFLGAIGGVFGAVVWILGVLSVLATPYVVFSISYQAWVAHGWCRLCLAVQGVIVAEAAMGGLDVLSRTPQMGPTAYTITGIGLASAIVGWSLLRTPMQALYQKDRWRVRAERLRRDPNLLEPSVEVAPEIRIQPIPGDYVIGPSEAEHTLVIVTRPDCPLCLPVHRAAVRLVEESRGKVSLVVRFLCRTEGRHHDVALHCLALHSEGREEEAHEFLDRWMGSYWRFAAWRSRPALENPERSLAGARRVLAQTIVWADWIEVSGTPEAFWDGRRLAPTFDIEDLAYLPALRPSLRDAGGEASSDRQEEEVGAP